MKYSEFMTAITSYYGQYANKFQSGITLKYICTTYNESELDDVFKKLVATYTNKYKTPPDIAVFEKLFSGSTTKPMRAWELIKNLGSMDSYVFEDIIIQATIQSGWSNWSAFVDHREKDEYWCQKSFLGIYEKYMNDPPDIQPQVMIGYRDTMNIGNKFEGKYEPVMIGDVEKCKQILDSRVAPKQIKDIANSLIKKI